MLEENAYPYLIKLVHFTHHVKALTYGMLLMKKFKHFETPLQDETFVKLYPTDIINIQTLNVP